MRVLVTGGSGFIGSHVVDKLRARGHEPVIYDLRPSPWHERGTVDTVLGSITDREALERALHSCDAVAHLAAVADVNDVHASPEDAERINARGTVSVLEAARRAGVQRIVYASTIWVYSDCREDAVDEDTLLPAPSHLYTSTKLAGELYCKAYQELYGIDYTILRFGIPYGPRAREAAVIPAFVNKALRGEPLTLAGDGSQSRRFVYVEDLADGVARGLSDLAANRVYNLASDENVTIKQIAETVQHLVGNVSIEYTPARPGDFGGKVVCSRRALAELGWSASTPFSEGVRRYVEWRREQAALAAAREAQAVIPAGEPDSESRPRQVLIISADIGEGHDLPARAVAREFRDEDPDAQVSIVNGLPAMGWLLTRLLRENSAFMFRWVPWWFDFQYRLFMNFAPTRWLARWLLTALGHRGLMRLIRAHNPDQIVSTYPGVTAVLGELRRRGRLDVPCYSSITDLAGLHFWAHPGIDLHFITHPESAEEVEEIAGPGSVRWAKPPSSPAFLAARSRADARRALALPPDGRVIAVSGGGWGVGDLLGATAVALQVPDAIVLCLCGRNDKLRARVTQRFGDEPRLRVMGFTDRMSDVLAATDALIHSSAGLTVLEAIIRGCPVVSYGFGYGHVRASNAALERFGLAQVAREEAELRPAVERALEQRPEPDGSFARRPSTASLILGDERRARQLPRWRVRTARAVTATAAVVAAIGWTLTAGASYTVVSRFAHMRPVTAVSTGRPEVGVLIDAPVGQVPELAGTLSALGIHASFTVGQAYPAAVLSVYGDQTLPRLPTGGLVRWLRTRAQLRRLIREMGLQRHFLYASNGPSVGQWWLAHGAGGRLVAGAVKVDDAGDALGPLRPGEVVELTLTGPAEVQLVAALSRQLANEHLTAVPVGRLMRDAGSSA
ncbi:MAG: NAD-dependent epimerase/dehydratase family protein [Solirubrobacterales bacterium]|nr:NAD-dependent epimerase/dehydratase family protein [Solirubrobacterales bacterium]MBV9715203.1 NAD-dependent epimerase/dehydratase family protein [Solirubrobacterales bacterium]